MTTDLDGKQLLSLPMMTRVKTGFMTRTIMTITINKK